ncbi:DUF342 domain-containing protein [Desertibacillus haloalkaliphilus]|uniref:DUF342 domain-containing protein n=1 Tax=Desertibacillus haloalkaliphilus TaxID=1328930 RepID=UPI001C259ACD|nr:FapA family protein [Desertibacillus haloalkaliphilus]MBU8906987.1 FapA family protein [Desertibacillus haloalkaliphilus]
MTEMDQYFEIRVSEDKMTASIIQHQRIPNDQDITIDEVKQFILEHEISYGLDEANIQKLVHQGETVESPLTIATGKKPINGEDAKLVPVQLKKEKENDEAITVDLKQVIDIPSVVQNQLVGEKAPATDGVPGMNVFAKEVPAKPGKDFRLRAGKNTRLDHDGTKLYAIVDGQVSVEQKQIHVYPVFEVHGDIDMKVGNISFVGNVTIRGGVPSGFKIESKGDIRIHGTVEAADLQSEGSIYVLAGIAAQGKGRVEAKQDVHTTFINQGNVKTGGDLFVDQSILHSECEAGGNIYCHKGNVVGGGLSAGQQIVVKNLGNEMNTPTSLYLGVSQSRLERKQHLQSQKQTAEEELVKLQKLLETYEAKEQHSKSLTPQERIMKLRIRNTIANMQQQLQEVTEDLQELDDRQDSDRQGVVCVEHQLYPNVDIHFGKYRRKIMSPHKNIRLLYEDGEIQLVSR